MEWNSNRVYSFLCSYRISREGASVVRIERKGEKSENDDPCPSSVIEISQRLRV